MKANYRITFYNGPAGNSSMHKDVYAKDSDDAFKQAYRMPEAQSHRYSDVAVEEIPDGPSCIGIEFETYDRVFRKTFTNYIFVLAEDEVEARSWYRRNLMEKKTFCIYPDRPEVNEKSSYGRIKRTYFACGCGGFDAKIDLE